MVIQKVRFLFFLLLGLCWLSGQGLLYAQEYDDDDYQEEPDYDDEYEDSAYDDDTSKESDWDSSYMPELYSQGDQTFTITMGVIFPTVFLNNNGKVIDHHFEPPVGGAGSLAYTYFLDSYIFLGAELGVAFNYTLAQNTVFLIPIGVRAGWQFVIQRFEIPLMITMGIVPQRYLDNEYLGFFFRGGASVFFRFSPEWSFGLNTDWSWYPQRPQKNNVPTPQKNVDGNIIGVTLSARYHF